MEVEMSSTALTVREQDQQALSECEATIQEGIQKFMDVGAALLRIQHQKLYREDVAGFRTFEEYCRVRWNISRPRAYQLIDAVKIAREMSTLVDMPPANERQIRELAPLPPEQRPLAWQQVVEQHGHNATMREVRAVVESTRFRYEEPREMTVADLGDDIPPYPEQPENERVLYRIGTAMSGAIRYDPSYVAAADLDADSLQRELRTARQFRNWLDQLIDGLEDTQRIRRVK
jgi:hypothetical protein